jgi:hypothetical protein
MGDNLVPNGLSQALLEFSKNLQIAYVCSMSANELWPLGRGPRI